MKDMYTVETKLSFEAAHRLYNVDTYSSECRENIHGHSYKVTIVLGTPVLNSAEMVMDFKWMKELLKTSIENPYDHSCILLRADPLCEPISKNCKKVHIVDDNPTAEAMTKWFYDIAKQTLGQYSVKVLSVSVQETENNIATYVPEDSYACE